MKKPTRTRAKTESCHGEISKVRHGLENEEWAGKFAFEQFQLATHGNKIYDPRVGQIIQKLDFIVDREKNGLVPESETKVWDVYFREIGRKFGDLWWKAKQSKNGEAFRQFAWAAEFTTPQKPDRQFASLVVLEVKKGRIAMPPVTTLVKLFNDTWRHQVQPRPPKTSYVQMDRICKALGCPTPKKERKRKKKRS